MPEPDRDTQWPDARRVGLVAVGVGAGIVAAKFVVYALTGAVIALGDALESIINVAAAAVALYTLHLSNKPPDRAHPYGHGKAEFIAIAFEGALIFAAGATILVESGRRLLRPREITSIDTGVALLGVITLGCLALGLYVWLSGRRLRNPVLIADGRHLLTDVLTSAGGVAGLLLVRLTGWGWLDPLLALVLGGLVVFTALRLLDESISGLMDSADPTAEHDAKTILERAVRTGVIMGFHKLRIRRAGRFYWVDVHLHLPDEMTVAQSHDIASAIEHEIEQALVRANVTAHVEPVGEQRREGEMGVAG